MRGGIRNRSRDIPLVPWKGTHSEEQRPRKGQRPPCPADYRYRAPDQTPASNEGPRYE